MKKPLIIGTWVIFAALLFLVSACVTKSKEEGNGQAAQLSKIQKLNVDIETEKKYQEAADKGYQPWKRNAMEVAEECLINTGVGARKGECKVLSDDGANATVFVNTKDGNFKIKLKRLVKPDGIWTATEIEKE